MDTAEYGRISVEDALGRLEATAAGLGNRQAAERQARYGENSIPEQRPNTIVEFLRRYWGPMPWLLELAMALSFVLGHILEGLIIFGLLTANAIIGYEHARGSRQAVELLKRRLAAKARVLRDGKWMTAPAAATSSWSGSETSCPRTRRSSAAASRPMNPP
jgi:H+-transporting ATPase